MKKGGKICCILIAIYLLSSLPITYMQLITHRTKRKCCFFYHAMLPCWMHWSQIPMGDGSQKRMLILKH